MATTPFKRLGLKDFNDICRAVLGWDSEIRYMFQIHSQEFNSFQCKTRSKRFATPDLVLHSLADYSDPQTVQTHVSRLRKKLGDKFGKRIENIHSLGYKLDA